MKRSLIASALLAGLVSIYAPASQAQNEAGRQNVNLSGQFSTQAALIAGTTDVYGFPIVGYACPSGAATCDKPRSGLLYNPNTLSGWAFSTQFGSATLKLKGSLLRFDNGDYLGWSANIGASPFDKANSSSVLQGWDIGYINSSLGVFHIGSRRGVSAFSDLRTWYSPIADNLDVDTGSFLVFPGAAGATNPFDYQAPGIDYQSLSWNGMSFAFSVGASVKQHKSLIDTSWVNDEANTDSYDSQGPQKTPPRAIQWAVAFNGYFRGIEGYLKPLAGQWMFSYAQSQQLNAPSIDEHRFKRAAHISFASIYRPLLSLNVVDLQWSQNTGVGKDGGYTQPLLQDLGLQSSFDGVKITEVLGEPWGQFVKPVPYWNAGISWTTLYLVDDTTSMAWSFGYTRTQTYGYDFPGVSPNRLSLILSRGVFNDPRLNAVYNDELYKNGLIANIQKNYFPSLKEDQYMYPSDYQLMAGKLIAQSIYVGARYSYMNPYFSGLKLELSGELVYAKATLQLEGTAAQVAKGYSTKPFDLGTDLRAIFQLSLTYSF